MSDEPPEYPPAPPPYPPQPVAQQQSPRNGLGIAALILGIIGAISGIIPLFFWLAGILGVIGLILGFAGRGRAKRREATNGTAALWGIITSAVAVVLSIVGLVILVDAFEQVDDDLSGMESPAPAPETTSAPAPEEAPATEEPPTAEPEVAVESFSGTSSQVVTLANPDTEPVRIVQFTAEQSDGNTVVWGVDESAADVALLVNTIGAYAGTRLINEGFQAQGVVAFKVEAAGPWSMTVSPISSARRWDGAAPLTGEGDDVVIVADGLQPGIAPVTFSHDGRGQLRSVGIRR